MAEIKRYTTPVFRISFPCLFEAESYDGGPPKFGCSAVWDLSKFTKKDKELWKTLKGALNAESLSRFGKKWKDLPANIKRGLRDGAEDFDDEIDDQWMEDEESLLDDEDFDDEIPF